MSPYTAFAADLDQPLTRAEKNRFVLNLSEYRARQTESLKLYEPMPLQQEFHADPTYIRLYIGGNRCGKSVGTAVEFARAVMACDPYDKYSTHGGKIYVVGKSLKHCADTIYPILTHPGAFKIIRDELTDDWRTYRPWVVADLAREKEAYPAPPLIPDRYIADVGWKSRAKGEIDTIYFTTGWTALFFSASGQQPQGSAADLVWFDEEIQNSKADGPWFPEMSARLIDRAGRIMWSAAPQKGYVELFELVTKGEKQAAEYRLDPKKFPKPDISVFRTKQTDNYFITADKRERFLKNLSAEEQLVRGGGEFPMAARLVYPEFDLAVHGYPLSGEVPASWTRYVFVDPGHTICAALFVACPPPEECPHEMPMVLAYDELYLGQANAAVFAEAMAEKAEHQQFEAFIIDMHGARPHEAGSGLSVFEQYETALEERRVFSRQTASSFQAAGDNRKAGVTRVHSWLAMRRREGQKAFDVPPLFRVKTDVHKSYSTCTNLVWEINRYAKKQIANRIIDEPNDRGPTHLCQCLRYCAMHSPEYVAVKMREHANRRMQRFIDQLKADQGGGQGASLSFGRSS